jgi:hypothetical protein
VKAACVEALAIGVEVSENIEEIGVMKMFILLMKK